MNSHVTMIFSSRSSHPVRQAEKDTSCPTLLLEQGLADSQHAGLFCNEASITCLRGLPDDHAQRHRPVHFGRVRDAWLRRGRLYSFAKGERKK